MVIEIKARFQIYDFTYDRSTLFSGIGLFGRTLKELYIKGPSTQYYTLSLLLDLLPALTHLTIKLKKSNETRSQYDEIINKKIRRDIQSNNDDKDENYNLVFLCLNTEFRRDFHIKQIVKRCPRLKYLLVSKFNIYEYPTALRIEFEHILELCPSIRYIHWGRDIISSEVQMEWLTWSRRGNTENENKSGYEKREASHLRQVELYCEDVAQHISTLTTCLQEPSLLEHLCLSTLCSVELCDLWNSFTQDNSNLLSWPSRLKSLELDSLCVPYQTENNIFSQDLFVYFQNIERLKMRFHAAPTDSSLEERKYMSKVVEAIGHQLHQLRQLYLDFSYYDECSTKIILCDNFFTTLCNWNQKLETLRLRKVLISNDMLLNLCDHPNLHTLHLADYQLHKHLTKDGWISFAHKLKEQEQNGGMSPGRFQSISLSCAYYDDVTDEVLEEFADVKSLKTLQIECNRDITDEGIIKFASIKRSSTKSYEKIKLSSCIRVSLDNPYVVFTHPHF